MSPAGAIGVNVAMARRGGWRRRLCTSGHSPMRTISVAETPACASGPAHAAPPAARGAARAARPGPAREVQDPKVLPLFLSSPLLPLMQRRIFFGASLPPLDPAFSFRGPAAA